MNVRTTELPLCYRDADLPAEGVAEVPLLLSTEQAVQLEWAAQRRGLTVGQMLRWAVRALLHEDGAKDAGLEFREISASWREICFGDCQAPAGEQKQGSHVIGTLQAGRDA